MTHSLRKLILGSLRNFLLTISLFAATASMAQGPVAGYDILGSCGGHTYYISKAYVSGLEISPTVAAFRATTGLSANNAYAAAIVNQTENDCVQNLMLTYNMKYNVTPPTPGAPYYSSLAAGNKSTFPNWGDPRNPWIGLTDAQVEGTFVWSNGQPNCEDFRNWNRGEPNNFVGTTSNGEDFTQMLIMNTYGFNGNASDQHNPLGKWNDWFNDLIANNNPPGSNLGPTKLPLIIEVGPADCSVGRGNLGCSHGYWKNASDKSWNVVGGLSRLAKFSIVFGITNGRGVITLGTTTMQDALELKGGGYNQVGKQGVAALMNANSGIYPYTSAEIIAAVQSIFNNGTASLPNITVNGKNYTGGSWTDATKFASYLDMLNNLGCPINNHGDFKSNSTVSVNAASQVADQVGALAVTGFPNPSRTAFNIQLNGLTSEKVSIKVTDIAGRIVEQRSNIAASQVLTIGNAYRAGMYNIQVIQGTKTKNLKMMKQ